jgi:HTH-type transcriptional regulator/antitoxin HigA
MPKAEGVEVLRFLMREHGLSQRDLPEVGTQSVVSEVLAEKRQLNVRQIRALSKRFGVTADVFF